jgi:tRNA (cytidine/uridine-2'-O-)-methyltransferase
VFHIILYQPEIPPNTGNVIRLCANTGCQLHLIGPLGFSIDDSAVRRAGLDYREMAAVHTYGSLDACLQSLAASRLLIVETGSTRRYSDHSFAPGDALLFGPETRGLPEALVAAHPAAPRLSIPMRAGNRSLNLSNAVAVVVFEAWRQLAFQTDG